MDDQLPEWVKAGVAFRVFDKLYHVRGVVDGRAVVRLWLPSKRRWEYVVKDWTYFHVNRNEVRDVTHAKQGAEA